jgi:hypothetical protein
MNSIDQFVTNWSSNNAMVPISADDITALEAKLALCLPDAYKYLITSYGLIHTPNVLTKICHLNADISEVQDFLSLEDVDMLSKLYELSGMPKGHTLFASDCKGNMFCFKNSDCLTKQLDVPVWFFEQSLGSVKKVSNSFIEWLDEFNAL